MQVAVRGKKRHELKSPAPFEPGTYSHCELAYGCCVVGICERSNIQIIEFRMYPIFLM